MTGLGEDFIYSPHYSFYTNASRQRHDCNLLRKIAKVLNDHLSYVYIKGLKGTWFDFFRLHSSKKDGHLAELSQIQYTFTQLKILHLVLLIFFSFFFIWMCLLLCMPVVCS